LRCGQMMRSRGTPLLRAAQAPAVHSIDPTSKCLLRSLCMPHLVFSHLPRPLPLTRRDATRLCVGFASQTPHAISPGRSTPPCVLRSTGAHRRFSWKHIPQPSCLRILDMH
jgi:hypothetical protein